MLNTPKRCVNIWREVGKRKCHFCRMVWLGAVDAFWGQLSSVEKSYFFTKSAGGTQVLNSVALRHNMWLLHCQAVRPLRGKLMTFTLYQVAGWGQGMNLMKYFCIWSHLNFLSTLNFPTLPQACLFFSLFLQMQMGKFLWEHKWEYFFVSLMRWLPSVP